MSGRYLRLALLLAAFGNGSALLILAEPAWLRLGRLLLVGSTLGMLWWLRDRIPSRVMRLAIVGVVSLWMCAVTVVQSAAGWPLSLDTVPVMVAIIALVVDWRVAVSFVVLIGGVAIGCYATGLASMPAGISRIASNWMLVNAAMLYLVWSLFRVLERESDDLILAANELEHSQREATVVAAKVAHQVKQTLETLSTSLTAGPAAVRAALDATLEVLRESRRRIPPEPPHPSDEWSARIGRIRASLARDLVRFGVLIYSFRVFQNLWRGRPAIAVVIGVQLLLLLAVVAYHRWRPHHLRRSLHVAAAIMVVGAAVNMVNWEQLPLEARVLPSIPISMILLILLGVVGGDERLIAVWAPVLGMAVVIVQGSRGLPALLVCLLYIALGFMLASLQRTVLQEIVHRQARASSVIRHRRRLIGTLFHDLANPLQALALQVEPPDGGEATSPSDAPPVPTDAAPLVQRMRATLDAALGQLQPAERLTPAALVDALLAVFGARLAEKRIHLVPLWEPEAAVVANRSLLQDTILANLLSNAIKFTPVGGTITLRGERAGPVVHLEIADQGPGLPEAVRTAFEAGLVAPSRRGTAGEIGSGYGLLLVRDYLREMGGSLAFERPRHGGLVARIVLPAG